MRKRLWDLAKSRIEIGTILPGHRHKVGTQAAARTGLGSLPLRGDALINPPDLRQRSDISFFKVQGVNKRFMIGLLRRTMRQSTGRLAPDHPRTKTS